MPAFFVTGTDTEVGKTYVTCALLRAAGRLGWPALGLKPVAAGCEPSAAGLRNEDALALMEASSIQSTYDNVNPIALAPPIAPHIAAAETGVKLSVAELVARCQGQFGVDRFVVVEGAGGWLVPLNETETLADLATALELPVILVVGLRLGCINHALLSAESIRGHGLSLAGWVANSGPEPMQRQAANVDSLAQRLGVPCIGQLPWLATAATGEQAAGHLNLSVLLNNSGY